MELLRLLRLQGRRHRSLPGARRRARAAGHPGQRRRPRLGRDGHGLGRPRRHGCGHGHHARRGPRAGDAGRPPGAHGAAATARRSPAWSRGSEVGADARGVTGQTLDMNGGASPGALRARREGAAKPRFNADLAHFSASARASRRGRGCRAHARCTRHRSLSYPGAFDLGSQACSLAAPTRSGADGASVRGDCGSGLEAAPRPSHSAGSRWWITSATSPSADDGLAAGDGPLVTPLDVEPRMAAGFVALPDREGRRGRALRAADACPPRSSRMARSRGIRTAAPRHVAGARPRGWKPSLPEHDAKRGGRRGGARALLVEEEFGAARTSPRWIPPLGAGPAPARGAPDRLRRSRGCGGLGSVEQRRAAKRAALSAWTGASRRRACSRRTSRAAARVHPRAGVDTAIDPEDDAPRESAAEPRLVAMGDTCGKAASTFSSTLSPRPRTTRFPCGRTRARVQRAPSAMRRRRAGPRSPRRPAGPTGPATCAAPWSPPT